MEARAYKDKKGRVLFVCQAEGGTTPWRTHYHHPKTGVLCYLVNKDMPWAKNQDEAQENLDAYALQHELEAAENPDQETSGAPVDVPEETVAAAAGGAEGLAPEEGDSAVSATPPNPTQDEKDEKKRQEHEHTMDLYHEELRRTATGLIRTKNEKKEADQDFNETIKAYDAQMSELLYKMREEESRYAGYMAPPPPGALPFDAPVNPEVDTEGAPTLDGEPPTVPCDECVGAGMVGGQPCTACMGTGNIIPQPEPEPEEMRGACSNCGHPAAGHFDENGNPRRCVVGVCVKDGVAKGVCRCPEFVPPGEEVAP